MPKWSCTFEDQQNLSTLLGYSTKCYIVRLIELQDLWNQCGDGPTNKHHQWVVDQPKWSARQLPVDSVDGTIMIQWKTWSTLGKKHIIVKKNKRLLFVSSWVDTSHFTWRNHPLQLRHPFPPVRSQGAIPPEKSCSPEPKTTDLQRTTKLRIPWGGGWVVGLIGSQGETRWFYTKTS